VSVEVETKVERTFVTLTYFELAYLLTEANRATALVRDALPLPLPTDNVGDYLDKGRALYDLRTSALAEDDLAYHAAIERILGGFSEATSSVVVSMGTEEPVVVVAFSGGGITIDLVVLPGGNLLIGALEDVSLRETIVPSYLLRNGSDSATLLASRSDGTRLWMVYEDGTLRTASGDSFDTRKNGPDWQEAVVLIIDNVDSFMAGE
jgi:hypothetical protein